MTHHLANHPGQSEWIAKLAALLDECPSDDEAAEAVRRVEKTRLSFHPPGSKLEPFEQLGAMGYSDGTVTVRAFISHNN